MSGRDSMLEQRVRELLGRLQGPAAGPDLVSRGRVRDVETAGDEVTVVLFLDPASSAAERAELEDRVRRAVEELEGVGSCLVDVHTAEHEKLAAEAAARRQEAGRREQQGGRRGGGGDRALTPRPQPLAGVSKILAVASGKGGVGKSTVACNLALALAGRGLKIGLLDADMHGPSFPTLLGLGSVQPRASQGRVEPIQAHGLSVMSLGFLLDPDQPVIWRGPMIAGAIRQLLQDVVWEGLDVLVVDLPPGTGDAQLTLVQTVQVDRAVIVTTPSDLALSDARRGLLMFRQVEVPVLGIIENMSCFCCPHCGQRSDVFGAGGGRRTADRLHLPFLGEIPLDLAIGRGNDHGRPIVLAEPEAPAARIFADLARTVAESLGFPGNGKGRASAAECGEGTLSPRKGLLASLLGK